jgi:transposase
MAPLGLGALPEEATMERIVERGCGLDVHKKSVAACLRAPGPNGQRLQEVRTFGTTAAELLALRDWLEGHRVTHVAMESTGVYWKPIFYVLEEALTCVLVNPVHMRQVPGRKTDVQDCVWIAQLLEHGLLRGSFVADIKLASVATDVLGVSGRATLESLIRGITDPDTLADLARGALRKKLPALRQALAGRFRGHHAFLLSQILAHVDYVEEAITAVSEQIGALLEPFRGAVDRLITIPGVKQRTAEVVVAEIGVDMSVFPSAAHLASWAALCPGNNESAGKHRSGKTRRGNPWLRTALIEAALGAIRHGRGALAARYRRIMRHRGHKKAVVALAHAMLVAIYYLLARNTTYHDLGDDYCDRRHAERAKSRALQTLERQGYRVTLEPVA